MALYARTDAACTSTNMCSSSLDILYWESHRLALDTASRFFCPAPSPLPHRGTKWAAGSHLRIGCAMCTCMVSEIPVLEAWSTAPRLPHRLHFLHLLGFTVHFWQIGCSIGGGAVWPRHHCPPDSCRLDFRLQGSQPGFALLSLHSSQGAYLSCRKAILDWIRRRLSPASSCMLLSGAAQRQRAFEPLSCNAFVLNNKKG